MYSWFLGLSLSLHLLLHTLAAHGFFFFPLQGTSLLIAEALAGMAEISH